jgi:hypothetical protein
VVSGAFCIGLFVISILGLVLSGPLIFGMLETTFTGHADGLGMGFFAILVAMVSSVAFGLAMVLFRVARHLPRGFRFLTLFPGALGIATGAIVFLVLLAQGK